MYDEDSGTIYLLYSDNMDEPVQRIWNAVTKMVRMVMRASSEVYEYMEEINKALSFASPKYEHLRDTSKLLRFLDDSRYELWKRKKVVDRLIIEAVCQRKTVQFIGYNSPRYIDFGIKASNEAVECMEWLDSLYYEANKN